MIALDERVQHLLYGGAGAHGALSTLMIALTILGAGWSALMLLPLLCFPRTRLFAALLTAAIAAQSVLVWATKAAVGRVRPWIALGLPAPIGSPSDFSFPSGHAAGSFCLAAFLSVALPAAWPSRPGRARIVGALAFLYAALVAASRVYLGAHFPGDVLAGAVLGSSIGAAAAVVYTRRRV